MLSSILTLRAQDEPDPYYPYADYLDRREIPLLRSDSSLFHGAIGQRPDLYGDLTRYAFREVAYRRRGIAYRDERTLLDGLDLGWRHAALLRQVAQAVPSPWVGHSRYTLLQDPQPTQHRLQLALTDSRYRLALRYRSRLLLPHDWHLGLYAEGRIGDDRFSEGCYTRSLSAALRLDKRWRTATHLSLMVALAPSERGLTSLSTQEAFDLVGDNYYNPAWGFHDGRVRSGRVRRELLPLFALQLAQPLTPSTTLRLTAAAELGTLRNSSIGWFDAPTPRPDNYRYLPSYHTDPHLAEAVADRWRAHDSRYTQINWDELCAQNSLSQGGAYYIEQDRVEQIIDLKGQLTLRTNPSRGPSLTYGLAAHYRQATHFLEVRDLLGADYLLDIDYYLLDDDSYATSLQNDLHNPDRRVVEGERFGHSYALEHHHLWGFLGVDYHHNRWSLRGYGEVGVQRLRRVGHYEKELFPAEGSYGPSHRISLMPYHLWAMVGYTLSPKMHLHLQLAGQGVMPQADDLFLQPQYNNRTIDRPTLEHRYDLELKLQGAAYALEWSVAAFLHQRSHGVEVVRYYDDLSALFVDRVAEQIGERTYGVELATRIRLASRWSLRAALLAQRPCYTSNPQLSLYSDRDNRLLAADLESHMGPLRPGGIPQLAALLAATYYGRQWGVGCDLTYAGLRSAHPDFMRRTDRVALQVADTKEHFELFNSAERLPDLFRLELSAWRYFRLGDSCRLLLSLRVENLLGDESTPYDSYESPRIRRLRVGDDYTYHPFPSNLSYAASRTLYLSAALLF